MNTNEYTYTYDSYSYDYYILIYTYMRHNIRENLASCKDAERCVKQEQKKRSYPRSFMVENLQTATRFPEQ